MGCRANPLYFLCYLTNYNSFVTEHLYADRQILTNALLYLEDYWPYKMQVCNSVLYSYGPSHLRIAPAGICYILN